MIFKNKKLLIAAGGFVIVGILILIASFRTGPKPLDESQTAQPSPTVSYSVPTVSQEETMMISGVLVKNFYNNSGSFNENNDVLLFENGEFSISYMAPFEQFIISLDGTNFPVVRTTAEQKFLELLGIGEEDACRLSVTESVPVIVESEQAGGVFYLSFCEQSSR